MSNHTDKELLELAAKAAGLNVKMFEVDQDGNFSGLIVGTKNTKEKIWWNPLVSDGDAFRLSVNLSMSIQHLDLSIKVTPYLNGMCCGTTAVEVCGSRQFATRRAIVRSAAALGEKL